MTATEELCRLLDERGVELEDGGEGLTIIPAQDGVPVAWEVNTWPSGKDMGDCLWVQNRHPLTPEQAIAATLGRGMLTADDVRDLIERHSDASGGNGRDFHNGAYVAIADELNATLGPGTCHADETDTMECVCDGIGHYGKRLTIHVMECSDCGRTYEHVFGDYEYCPHCRARIVEVDEGD